MPNTYEMFVWLALTLARHSGFIALLLPDRIAFNIYLHPLRTLILETTTLAQLTFKLPFPGVTVDVVALASRKRSPPADHKFPIAEWGHDSLLHLQSSMLRHPVHAFEYYTSRVVQDLMTRLDSNPKVRRLDFLCSSTSGFGGKSKLITAQRESHTQIEILKGENIRRYEIGGSFWFEFVRANITGRTTDQRKLGATPKVLLRKMGDSLIAAMDQSSRFPEQSLYFLFDFVPDIDPRFILGLLNSRLMNYYFRRRCLTNADSIAQVKKTDLDALPIRVPSSECEHDRRLRDDICEAVTQLEDKSIRDHVAKRMELEKRIDSAIYRLYELDDTQISIVVGASDLFTGNPAED